MENKMKPQALLELISSIISAAFFLFSTLIGWFLPNSSYFMLISGLILILSIIVLQKSKSERIITVAKFALSFSLVLCILSGVGLFYYQKKELANDEQKRLCELTDEAIEMYKDWKINWFSIDDVTKDNILYYYTVPDEIISSEDLVDLLFDKSKFTLGEEFPFKRRLWSNTGTKYSLLVLKADKLKNEINSNDIIRLPRSVNLTVCGYSCLDSLRWDDALKFFQAGYKAKNGVSAYYLYILYKNGCGMERTRETQEKAYYYLNESASLGYRKAQLEYGLYLIRSDSIDEMMMGEKYLKNAALLSDFRTGYGMTVMERAIEALQEYYVRTNQYEEAYQFTKLLLKHNQLERQRIERHLDNCIYTNRIKEANDIIRKGKKLGIKDSQHSSYCYVAEAIMTSKGIGENEVDLAKAERLLRFASDSLDSRYARRVLSELYEQNNQIELSKFWARLYEVDYHKTIKE